ncbi:MAG: maleylpyruvate isomerase family mycothiol-dependent enzyme [Nocardioidaceae bacterium]
MDLHALIRDSFTRLADSLEQQPPEVWDQPSLCAGWRVRDVVAHVTMPARLTTEQFLAELAGVGGDFQLLSDTIAVRDGGLPVVEHLTHLRSPQLAEWEPPGGGAIGALNHAVVHGLDVTNALGLPRACTDQTAKVILDDLTTGGVAARFDVDLSTVRLQADDIDWSSGSGRDVIAPAADIISLACHRTLRDGRALN